MATLNPHGTTLAQSSQIQGIAFLAGTQIFYGLSGELVLCVLPDDLAITGIPCRRGLVHFHPDGSLAQATLSAPHTVRGHLFPADTTIIWSEDGTMRAALQTDHPFGTLTIPAGATLRLAADGTLIWWSRRLTEQEQIAGLPCQARSIVSRFADGSPARATLAEHHTIQGLPCMAGTDVEFHPNGTLAVATVAATVEQNNLHFGPGTAFVFRPDASLSVAHLAHELAVNGQSHPDGSYLQFDEHGHLTAAQHQTWRVHHPALS